MSFNFKSYTANNPLLQEVEEEVSVSSSGVEMEGEEQYQYPMAEFGEAVYKASQAGISKETLHKLVDWNAD